MLRISHSAVLIQRLYGVSTLLVHKNYALALGPTSRLISLASQAAVLAALSHKIKQGLLNDSCALLVLLIL